MIPGRQGDVAIIGMACLFPGAPNLDTYWNNILGKVDCTSDPPPEAWDPDVYYQPDSSGSDRVYCKRGGFLGKIASFDPLPHGIPPVAVGGEPDQWLALQVARDALVDAGYPQLEERVRQRTAVIIGKGTYLNAGNALAVQHGLIIGQTLGIIKSLLPTVTAGQLEMLREEMKNVLPPTGPEIMPGLIPNIIVGRIANRLDLMGPSYTVDAACASSLVALERAIADLSTGACDLALVGGSQVWVPVATLNIFCQLEALSRKQQIRPFDEEADGTLLGEGIGMIVVKRLADAERDDDRIYAVVKGVGVASDGRGASVMAPRVEGEELALNRAYKAAGISPRDVGLIEAHGTGTPVGDLVEIQALARVFGDREGALPWCAIGSVKSMIAHTMPAAGIAGIIKTALALYHKVLPPTLNCTTPNPRLGLERTPFYINTESRPWIHGADTPRYAGVNAFGFGGINAHVVLEEHPEAPRAMVAPSKPRHAPDWDTEVVVLAAESAGELALLARDLARKLQAAAHADLKLKDVAYTVNAGMRAGGELRLAIVSTSLDDLGNKLIRAAERLDQPGCRRIKDAAGIYYSANPLARIGKIAFLFPGEGAEYPNMLADLCLHFPEVRQTFDRMDRILQRHQRRYLLSDFLYPRPAFKDEDREWTIHRLSEMDGAIQSVQTSNQALLHILRALGLQPDLIAGHSTGEFSAASAAGILSLHDEDALADFVLRLDQHYHASVQFSVPRAVLLAVGADREHMERIAHEAGEDVYLAMDNCPHQAVLVGGPEGMAEALRIVEREGLVYQRLNLNRAYHTPLFGRSIDQLRTVLDSIPMQAPSIPIYSSSTALPYPSEPDEIRTVMADHWVRPVEFCNTVEALYAAGARIFVEVGPRGNLTGFVEDILRGRQMCAVAANLRRRSGVTQLNYVAAVLLAEGAILNLDYLYQGRDCRTLDWAQVAQPRVDGKVLLATSFPMLRLSPQAVERVGLNIAAPAPAVSPPPPPRAPIQAAPAQLTPAPVAHQPASNPLLQASSPRSPESGGVLQDYLAAMDQFLETQQQVLCAYLSPTASGAANFPLLGNVVSSVPGQELVAERAFDMSEDLYLRDHTLGREVSRTKPHLTGLATMALTMSLEIMAEAASALLPGGTVLGLRDVRATRWLAWDGDPQVLQTTARVVGANAVHVVIRNLTEDGQSAVPLATPAVEALVLLGAAYASPPAAHQLIGAQPSTWAADRLYPHGMFHGPLWQGVQSMDRTADDGAVATLRVLPFGELFRSVSEPVFALDPLTLDAAGQVIGFWAKEQIDPGEVVFPFRVEAIDIFGPLHPAGELLTCSASIALQGSQQIRSTIDVISPEGTLWMRLTGWTVKRFAVPRELEPLMLPGTRPEITEPCPEAIAGFTMPGSFACRRLSVQVPSDTSFWKRLSALRILGPAERELFRQLRTPEPRQIEWLAGRSAAKEAVLELVRRHYGLDLLPADVEILPDERGRPEVHGEWAPDVPRLPTVSLAHSAGLAVAVAALSSGSDPDVPVGIDVERLRPSQDFANVAFGNAERQLFDTVSMLVRDEWMVRAWSAKEAAAKAVGYGLADGPGSVVIAGLDVPRQCVHVQLAGQLVRAFPRLEGVALRVHTLRLNDHVLAATACEQVPAGVLM